MLDLMMAERVVCLLTPYTLIQFRCVLTYPLYQL